MLTRVFDPFFSWLEGLAEPFPKALPVKPPTEFWAFIYHYSKPFRNLIIATALLATVIAILEVAVFASVGNLVDWLAQSDRETFFDEYGVELLLLLGLVVIILPALKLVWEAVVHNALLGNFAMRNRWQAHRYVLRQSFQFFNDDFAGRVATKVMQSAISVREVVMKLTEVVTYVGVYFTSAVIMFAATDWRLAIPMVLWFAAYIGAMRYFIPRLGEVSMRQSDARSVVTGRIVDSYTNIQTVKLFAHAEREDAYAKDGMVPFLANVHEQMRLVTLLTFTLNTLNAFLIAGVAGAGVWLWSVDAITTGAIAFSVGLVLRLQGMAHWIMWETAGIFENIGVVRDGIETIARDRSVVDKPDAKPLIVTDGRIVYDRIRFNYGKDAQGDARVLNDLSLEIRPGEKVGLVGRSGAGKSTLVNLLLRFYDLEGGRILIDGQDISAVAQESLRAHIAMVTQDTSLMHRSVMENILYGRPDATRDEAIAAAKKAHAHDFILGLEDGQGRTGYEAHVGERGVKLSGGQRQRIAIARVLLKDAPILILDEATSALDSEVEAAIQEQFNNLMQGKTVIAIAHRLSTIAAMDRLIIMDRGNIIEQGSHEELLRRGGLYADLWTRQSGGFLLESEATTQAAE